MSNRNAMLKKHVLEAYLEAAFGIPHSYTVSGYMEVKYFFLGYLNNVPDPHAANCMALATKNMKAEYQLGECTLLEEFIAEWKAKPEYKRWLKRVLLRKLG